jgi:hypothetical protein
LRSSGRLPLRANSGTSTFREWHGDPSSFVWANVRCCTDILIMCGVYTIVRTHLKTSKVAKVRSSGVAADYTENGIRRSNRKARG